MPTLGELERVDPVDAIRVVVDAIDQANADLARLYELRRTLMTGLKLTGWTNREIAAMARISTGRIWRVMSRRDPLALRDRLAVAEGILARVPRPTDLTIAEAALLDLLSEERAESAGRGHGDTE